MGEVEARIRVKSYVMSDNSNVSALARFQNHREAATEARPSSWLGNDPWEDLLKEHLEAGPGADNSIIRVVTPDGQPEWRVKSRYLLANVLGLVPERNNGRLSTLMRKLGWTGPKDMRFRGKLAKGYFKAAED
jgi:hypothetical protein